MTADIFALVYNANELKDKKKRLRHDVKTFMPEAFLLEKPQAYTLSYLACFSLSLEEVSRLLPFHRAPITVDMFWPIYEKSADIMKVWLEKF